MKKFLLSVSVLLFLLSCGNSSNKPDNFYNPVETTKMESKEQSFQDSETAQEPKIIKSGNMTFKSDDLSNDTKQVERLIGNNKVRVIENSGNNSDYRIEKNFLLNIPSEKYEVFISELERILGDAEYKHISSQDITAQYIDSEARMNSKRKLEERYLELLNKANSVSEIMEIERELANLRAEIESYQNTLNTYDSQIQYSSLQLNIYQEISRASKISWGSKFAESFSRGWEYFIWFFVGLFSFWPFIIFGTIIVIFVIRFSNRKKRNKAQL